MSNLIALHRFQYAAAALVVIRKLPQVLCQVAFDLAFRFSEKAEAQSIADGRRGSTNNKGSRVPQRIEDAGARIQLLEPLLAPGQMIAFLGGGLQQILPGGRRSSHQGLAVVERLGRDLTGMVYPHQSGNVAAVGLREGGGFRQVRNAPDRRVAGTSNARRALSAACSRESTVRLGGSARIVPWSQML